MPLLLSPHRLLTDHIIIESLHITKTSKGVDLNVHDLTNTELKKHYPDLHKDAREALSGFNEYGIHLKKTI